MGVAAHVLGPDRAYLGTDTRVWELLLGGLGAMALRSAGPTASPCPVERGHHGWASGSWPSARRSGRARPGGSGTVGSSPSALGALVVVVGSVRHPEGPVARVLAVGPAAMARPDQLLALPVALARHRGPHDVEHGVAGCRAAERPAWPPCSARRASATSPSNGPCGASTGVGGGAAPSSRPRSSAVAGRGARGHRPPRRGLGRPGPVGPRHTPGPARSPP